MCSLKKNVLRNRCLFQLICPKSEQFSIQLHSKAGEFSKWQELKTGDKLSESQFNISLEIIKPKLAQA